MCITRAEPVVTVCSAMGYARGRSLATNCTTYYYITNLQGDVMYLIDANENTVAAYEYDPYGNIVSATGTMAEINPLRYRGYYYDAELEMYYLQSRYYDPQISRFINADIVLDAEYVIGFNLFTYCRNSPINAIDESGCLTVEITQTGNQKYRFVCKLTDLDIREAKRYISITQIKINIALQSLGIVFAVPTGGTSLILNVIGIATEALNQFLNTQIDYYNYGKGAVLSFDFGILKYYMYTPKYGKVKTLFGVHFIIVGFSRHTCYQAYLRSIPRLTWNK